MDPVPMDGSRSTADSSDVWGDLLEQLRPFSAHAVFEIHEAGRIAAGARQGFGKAGANRIGGNRKHDWHRAARLQHRRYGGAAGGQYDFGRLRGQFRGVPADFGAVGGRPAGVDADVAPDRPTRLLQSLQEGSEADVKDRIVRIGGTRMAMRRTRSCARAASGIAAAPPSTEKNSRRLRHAPCPSADHAVQLAMRR